VLPSCGFGQPSAPDRQGDFAMAAHVFNIEANVFNIEANLK